MLITGGNGFIGKNLKDYLSGEYEIISPGHKDLDLLEQASVEHFLRFQKIDFILHSAMQPILGLADKDKVQLLKNNMLMFLNLELCSGHYKKMYYFGSGAEYAKPAYKPFMTESYFNTWIPSDDYGLSKYVMARILEQRSNIYDLRLFGVFGPGENYNYTFISNCICKMLKKKDIVIHRNVFFDYLYIHDLTKIMMRFLKITPKFQHYNVCTGTSVDILSIAQLIKRKMGSDVKIQIEQEGLNPEYSGDNKRFLNEIGKFEFTPLEQAIDELIIYYKNHPFQLEGNY